MKINICSLITRSSIPNISYSISIKSTFALLFCMGILLTTFVPSVLCWKNEELGRICSCGLQLDQQKFCKHDFVFAGKRVNRAIRKFNMRNSYMISKLQPYAGEIFRIRVIYNFKGIFVNYQKTEKVFVNVYLFQGSGCGSWSPIKLSRHKLFLFSGYRYKNMLVINACNWLQPFNEITKMQAVGLFQGHYENYCHTKERCEITFEYDKQLNFDNGCVVQTQYKECYDKHAICQLKPNNRCAFESNVTSLSKHRATNDNIPYSLKVKYRRPASFDDFIFCIRSKYSRIRSN